MENIALKTIIPGAFTFLDKVEEVYLGGNELMTISDGIFNTLTALVKLDLSNNRIQTVTDHAFADTSLKNLNLSNNNIENLEETVLHSLKDLTTLDISYNHLNNISRFRILSANKLQSMNFSHNSIEGVVDVTPFQKTSLSFDISYNNVTEILHLSEASKIMSLTLRHNKLHTFTKIDNVEVFDISYNNLKTLGNNSLSPKLLEFYASFNSISSLASTIFYGLHKLKFLYLDNNNISSIPNSCFKDLISLTHLNLSGNKLQSCKFGTFDSLLNLQVLDLSSNNFKELPQHTLHSLTKLNNLYFQNNEISNINCDDLFEYLKQLVRVDLNDNVWSCQRLAAIIHKLKGRGIQFPDGNAWEENNIHGIKCYEFFTETDLGNTSISKSGGDSNSKTLLNEYFNKDFEQSQFFKYLQNMKKSGNYLENNQVQKLLNEINNNKLKSREFEAVVNGSLAKYLQSFKDASGLKNVQENKLEEIANRIDGFKKAEETKLEEIANLFETISKGTSLERFTELKQKTESTSKAEKLTNSYEKSTDYPNYTGLLSVNLTLLLIILCVLLINAYRRGTRLNKIVFPKREEVELI
ncbi:hypothetical protein NQ315_007067 [Exocentrus adspersus]|uniref:Uncharacterized protein n=1 Tax=Exocentrus adspersus TaxID=1586481 RepID=A0AAV8WDX9_9CUCU|nr:hypothetical protein NQ315_007067 [Exocentrus adspersus]